MSKYFYQLLAFLISTQCFAYYDEPDAIIEALEARVVKLENQLKYIMESSDSDRINDLEQRMINLQATMERRSKASGKVTLQSVDVDQALVNIRKMIKNQEIKRAQQALERYLKEHKTGANRYEALYYLGDVYLLQGELLKAEPMFNEVANTSSNRLIPDALLRLVTIYWQTGRQEKASQTYHRLLNKYPTSSVAQLAKVQYQNWIDPS